MKKIKNLHIIPNDKFNKEFIEFINKNFDKEEHYFLLISVPSSKVYNITEDRNSNVLNYEFKTPKRSTFRVPLLAVELIKVYKILYSYGKKAEKIFFHDASNYQVLFLYFFRTILKKSYYMIWSTEKSKYEEKILFNKIFKYVKGNYKAYLTFLKGDYEIFQREYSAKGNLYYCFYPSNLYKEMGESPKKNEKTLYIQIGNSAQTCNNHIEILKKLEKYKDKNIKLICPLSYGNDGGDDYLKKVTELGKEIFEDKFLPMLDFLPYQDYLNLLNKIDIGIFAHNMQKALGNITSLISMKKTVYLKENTSTYKTFLDMNIKIKSFDNFNLLELFDEEILENNKKILKENFSKEKMKKEWEAIFNQK
jgi:4-alpha-L-fucosyltransferase (fuc4NAc transferase)